LWYEPRRRSSAIRLLTCGTVVTSRPAAPRVRELRVGALAIVAAATAGTAAALRVGLIAGVLCPGAFRPRP
jgi:hypothetical protein